MDPPTYAYFLPAPPLLGLASPSSSPVLSCLFFCGFISAYMTVHTAAILNPLIWILPFLNSPLLFLFTIAFLQESFHSFLQGLLNPLQPNISPQDSLKLLSLGSPMTCLLLGGIVRSLCLYLTPI